MGRWPIFFSWANAVDFRCPYTLEMEVTNKILTQLIEPTVNGLGFELTDLEFRRGRSGSMLRLFIDREDDGISVDDCEQVSRQVSGILDVEDPIGGNYRLEVSSPGLDRRLTKPAHFMRFAGAMVQVQLCRTLDGRRRIRGVLLERSDDSVIAVRDDGKVWQLPLADVDSVRLVPDLTPPGKK